MSENTATETLHIKIIFRDISFSRSDPLFPRQFLRWYAFLRFYFAIIIAFYSTFKFISLYVSNSSTILICNVSRDDNASWTDMAQWKLLKLQDTLHNRMITTIVHTHLFLMLGVLLYKLATIKLCDCEVKISYLTSSLGKSIERKE